MVNLPSPLARALDLVCSSGRNPSGWQPFEPCWQARGPAEALGECLPIIPGLGCYFETKVWRNSDVEKFPCYIVS